MELQRSPYVGFACLQKPWTSILICDKLTFCSVHDCECRSLRYSQYEAISDACKACLARWEVRHLRTPSRHRHYRA